MGDGRYRLDDSLAPHLAELDAATEDACAAGGQEALPAALASLAGGQAKRRAASRRQLLGESDSVVLPFDLMLGEVLLMQGDGLVPDINPANKRYSLRSHGSMAGEETPVVVALACGACRLRLRAPWRPAPCQRAGRRGRSQPPSRGIFPGMPKTTLAHDPLTGRDAQRGACRALGGAMIRTSRIRVALVSIGGLDAADALGLGPAADDIQRVASAAGFRPPARLAPRLWR